MTPPPDLFTPAIAGLCAGFVMSVPVGPVNITVINEALTRGFLRPFLIGLGAVTAEAFYCGLGLTSFQSVLNRPYVRSSMALVSFMVVTVLGLKYLFTRNGFGEAAAAQVEHQLEERLHLHRGYLIGLGMTLGNPFILLVWGTLATFLFAHGLVKPGFPSEAAFLSGMIGGSAMWFLFLSYITSRKHRKISPEALRLMTRLSGAFLLGVGVLLGAKLVQALALQRTPLLFNS